MAAVPKIGRIWLQGPDGRVSGTALYDLPVTIREPVLHIKGGVYRQTRQEPDGTWVYKFEGPLGQRVTDPDIKDFRTPDSPDWDGPAVASPPATMDDVQRHFEEVLGAGAAEVRLREPEVIAVYHHFLAARAGQPFSR